MKDESKHRIHLRDFDHAADNNPSAIIIDKANVLTNMPIQPRFGAARNPRWQSVISEYGGYSTGLPSPLCVVCCATVMAISVINTSFTKVKI